MIKKFLLKFKVGGKWETAENDPDDDSFHDPFSSFAIGTNVGVEYEFLEIGVNFGLNYIFDITKMFKTSGLASDKIKVVGK